MEKYKGARSGISFRALLIGLILVPFNCYWVTVTEIKWASNDSTCVSLFMTVVTLVFFLTMINLIIARYFPRHRLTQGELMVVYVMLAISTAMGGHDMMGNLLPNLANAFWFDTASNGWDKFHRYIPAWFSPTDPEVLRGFYEGNSSILITDHLKAWAVPVAVWGTFMMVLAFTMLCINVLIRKQWTDREKLTFPIVQMPLAMTHEGGVTGFFSNKIFWIGFGIPACIVMLNQLAFFYPTIPGINVKLYDVGQHITMRPWNGVGWFPISFYPFAIGLIFFLPADLSFSCWFFYLFRKALDVFAVAVGWRDPGASPAFQRFPYFAEQSAGAWIVLAALMIFASRRYLWQVIKRATGQPSELDDSNEPMSYRMALIGIIFGLMFLYVFCIYAGASPYLPIAFFALYFIVALAITRIRAELGPPAHELNFFRPDEILTQAFGTQALGPRNLTVMSYFYWFNRGYRNLVMPHQLEAFKIAEVSKINARKLTAVIILATFIGIAATFWSLLSMYYTEGAATAKIQAGYRTGIGSFAFDRLNGWLINPQRTDIPAMSFMGVGGSFAAFLTIMKARFVAWPFHPIGYGLAVSYAMDYFWFTAFLGWLAKILVVRYGGIKMYRQALPFFMGLILGDYVTASIWTLIGWALGITTYRTFIF